MFQKTVPIWAKDREKEMNLRLQFKAVLDFHGEKEVALKLATSGIYHVYVNGIFVSYGPARAGKGYFRVDDLPLEKYLQDGRNTIVIEVCGYYATSFYIQKQPSFLTAEVCVEEVPVLWTGNHFSARVNPDYIQKTQRYSYQRPMVEAYRIVGQDSYLVDESEGELDLSQVTGGSYVERKAPYPQYEKILAEEIAKGTVESTEPSEYYRDRSIVCVGTELSGFPEEELEVLVTDECQRMKFVPNDGKCCGNVEPDTYAIYAFPYNGSGMVTLDVECFDDVTIYLLFDEILVDGKVDFLRNNCANVVKYDLPKGKHLLQFFEVYTMKYIQVAAIGGSCKIKQLGMIEYKHPPVRYDTSNLEPELQRIADAAIETYRQNSVDLFTDCPSRERAGWLCDSFFTARTEYCLTGKNVIEKSFLENFGSKSIVGVGF